MDTILQPRYLSNTESESSDEDDGSDKKDSSSSSKITVVAKEGTEELKVVHAQLDEDLEDCEKLIISPTARFLQVNPKKMSSYDLLVHPPKRQRFIVHPSREIISNQSSANGVTFKQKVNPPIPNRSNTPTLECIYFENEKLKCRQTSKGSWSSSSSSGNPKKTSPQQQPPPPPMSLPRMLSEEHTLRQIERSQETNVPAAGTSKSLNNNRECCSNEESCADQKWKEFPATGNYAFYAHWTPSFQMIYREYENDRLQKDENRNYLSGTLSKEVMVQTEPQVTPEMLQELSPGPRRILRPVYRLRDLNGNGAEQPRPTTVYLKEDDYDSGLEISLFHEDERNRNKPPWKKQKFDKPGEYRGDEKKDNGDSSRFETIYKNRLPEINGNEVGAPSGLNDPEKVSSMFRAAYQDNSSMYYGTPVRLQTEEEFSVIHHPDLRDYTSDSVTIGEVDDLEKVENEEDSEENEEIEDIPMHQSPIRIFLNDSAGLSSGSGFHFGAGSFLNFGDEEEETEELEESRIVDVTDLIGDEEELLDWESENFDRHEHRGGGGSEMETIFKVPAPLTSTEEMQRESSDQCHLIDELLKNYRTVGSEEIFPSLASQESEGQQEVLMQPKPQLAISTSVYSTLERRLEPSSTTARFVEKRAKSDFYVGKVAGLSKSVMKQYRKNHSANLCDNGSGDMVPLSSEGDTYCESPPSPVQSLEEAALPKSSLENVLRKLSSPTGNRVYDIRTLTPLPTVNDSSTSTPLKPSKKKSVQREEPTTSTPSKSSLKQRKKPNIFKRIIRSFFRIGSQSKDKKNEDLESSVAPVPPSVTKLERRVAQHTDSRELYRERRQRSFKEQKKFHNESLTIYAKAIPSRNAPLHPHEEDGDPSGVATDIPVSWFQDINNNSASGENKQNKNSQMKALHDDTVSVPVRLAVSESAIADPAGGNQGRSRLLLRFPPFVQVLLATILARRGSLQQDCDENLEKAKEDLRKPLKGILKRKS